MTITVYPVDAVTGAPLYNGRKTRQALSVLCGPAPDGRPLGAVSGVRPGTPSNTVTASSSTWTVRPHAGMLDLEAAAAAGPYFYSNDANVTGSMTAADGTHDRIDLLSVRIDDPAESDGSSVPAGVFVYTVGTAASSPSPPATPARCLALAQISVPASGGGSPSATWVAPSWNSTIRAYQINTSGQTIPDTTTTTVTGWTTVDISGMGAYSAGVRTIATDGVYHIDGRITFPIEGGGASGIRKVTLFKNSTEIDVKSHDADSGHTTGLQVACTIGLVAGDTLFITAYQSQGSSRALTTGTGENHWSITRIGPL